MSNFVSAKKHLGQHFLNDENIAKKIVNSLLRAGEYRTIIEVGAGTGVLTKYLLQKEGGNVFIIEIDRESIAFLQKTFSELNNKIIENDFLKFSPDWLPTDIRNLPFAIIGNFPYNISSQILFKVLEYRNQIPEVVGMFQKEVAERVASPSGNKTYGILSVLIQAFYKIEYLFTVNPQVFVPPPHVKSGVIRLTRNNIQKLDCNEELFFKVVKAGFNQRRKTLRNALKSNPALQLQNLQDEILDKRAEQLSVNDFVTLANKIKLKE